DMVDLGSTGVRGQQVGPIPVASHGEHRRVLEKEQVVVIGPTPDLALMEPPLQIPSLLVRKPSQPAGTEQRLQFVPPVAERQTSSLRSRPPRPPPSGGPPTSGGTNVGVRGTGYGVRRAPASFMPALAPSPRFR